MSERLKCALSQYSTTTLFIILENRYGGIYSLIHPFVGFYPIDASTCFHYNRWEKSDHHRKFLLYLTDEGVL